MIVGEGRLVLDFNSFMVSDGTNFFTPLSFSLIRKLMRRKRRGDTVTGKWIVVRKWIVWFKKEERYA
jgi:hypothetical protein